VVNFRVVCDLRDSVLTVHLDLITVQLLDFFVILFIAHNNIYAESAIMLSVSSRFAETRFAETRLAETRFAVIRV